MTAAGSPRLVLASGSVTRRSLLEAAGVDFVVKSVPVNETSIKQALRADGVDAAGVAMALADIKAMKARDEGELVIGADQILVCEGEWFDKPVDLRAARQHLMKLRGRRHELMCAVTCWRSGGRRWSYSATPRLTMRPFSDSFLDHYLEREGEAVLSSVGAYRLEGLGMQLFSEIEGEYSAILGLPMLALLEFLRKEGVCST